MFKQLHTHARMQAICLGFVWWKCCFQSYILIIIFLWNKFSLCSLGWLGTPSNPPASTSQVLRSQESSDLSPPPQPGFSHLWSNMNDRCHLIMSIKCVWVPGCLAAGQSQKPQESLAPSVIREEEEPGIKRTCQYCNLSLMWLRAGWLFSSVTGGRFLSERNFPLLTPTNALEKQSIGWANECVT